MPRGDRRGPNGMGPMTGRAAGFCAGNDEAGWTSAPRWETPQGASEPFRGSGTGFGYGPGRSSAYARRRGFGRGFDAALGRGKGAGPGVGYGTGGDYVRRGMHSEDRRAALQAELDTLQGRIEYLHRELDAMSAAERNDDETRSSD